MTVVEGTHDSVQVCAEITIPVGKELGSNVEVPFIATSIERARKYI